MSGSKKMMLRIQTSDGTKRIEVNPADYTSALFESVYTAFQLNNFGFALYRDRARKEEIVSSKSRRIRDFDVQHGDMIYLTAVNGSVLFDQPTTSSEGASKSAAEASDKDGVPGSLPPSSAPPSTAALQEDEVDIKLYTADAKIIRARDEKLCRHGPKGCCVHCVPLEPYEEQYLRDTEARHLPFHAYLRQLMAGAKGGGKFPALDEITCKITPGCKEHPPWPRGICSKCQPNAVTLNRQPYRHVDNVIFEHPDMVERFLQYWRLTGHQRVAFLYGVYEPHSEIPLGIRARVAALYEPAQSGGRDSVTLLPDEKQELVDAIAKELGLTRVGWLFTDLLSEDASAGTVQHLRGIESHFLSAQECITAGHFQNLHPNVCRYATNGYFGSKFVTICVTGDSSKQVHMEGYQVSAQCAALVRDACLLPTRDAPELGWVRESSNKQYVPDVFYKEKDQYGNEVQRTGRPLPVEYLLVDVPVAAAREGALQATLARTHAFPPAHRPHAAPQGLRALGDLLRGVHSDEQFLEAMSDLHLLVWLASNETLALPMESLRPVLEAVRAGDAAQAARWRDATSALATLQHLACASADPDTQPMDTSNDGEIVWTCPHCTFDNPGHRDSCEICVLPRGNSM